MNGPRRTITAQHPEWQGKLVLFTEHGFVTDAARGLTGRYELMGPLLSIEWPGRPAERFVRTGERYVHEAMLTGLPSLRRFAAVQADGVAAPVVVTALTLRLPGSRHTAQLRLGTSDVAVFEQVFGERQFESPDLPPACTSIVDLGANIGLSSIYFAERYPRARVIAVEPDAGNFALLTANTAPFAPRVEAVQAAIWREDGQVCLTREVEEEDMGEWGVRVADAPDAAAPRVRALTMPMLLRMTGLDTVDILKIDIEGAELDLFSYGADTWLDRVETILIETHDRFRAGAEGAVRAALSRDFVECPRSGENLVFKRQRRVPEMTVDSCGDGIFEGWARYPERPGEPVRVFAMINGVRSDIILCDLPRPDVEAAGLTGALCGFRVALPSVPADGTLVMSIRDAKGEPATLVLNGVRYPAGVLTVTAGGVTPVAGAGAAGTTNGTS